MCFDQAKYQFAYTKQFLANPGFVFAFKKQFFAYLCRWSWSLCGCCQVSVWVLCEFCVGPLQSLCGCCQGSVWVLSRICVGFVKGLRGLCLSSVWVLHWLCVGSL